MNMAIGIPWMEAVGRMLPPAITAKIVQDQEEDVAGGNVRFVPGGGSLENYFQKLISIDERLNEPKYEGAARLNNVTMTLIAQFLAGLHIDTLAKSVPYPEKTLVKMAMASAGASESEWALGRLARDVRHCLNDQLREAFEATL